LEIAIVVRETNTSVLRLQKIHSFIASFTC